MSQEEHGPPVIQHRDMGFGLLRALNLSIDVLIQTASVAKPIIVQTEDEKNYIEAMALMMGKDIQVYHQHEKLRITAFRAAVFITIDLSSR